MAWSFDCHAVNEKSEWLEHEGSLGTGISKYAVIVLHNLTL
jgi:hypothetical protein